MCTAHQTSSFPPAIKSTQAKTAAGCIQYFLSLLLLIELFEQYFFYDCVSPFFLFSLVDTDIDEPVLILSQVLEKFCQGEARCALLVSEVRVTRPLIGQHRSRDLILASDWSVKQLSSLSLIGYSHLLKAPANRSMYRSKVSFKFNFS